MFRDNFFLVINLICQFQAFINRTTITTTIVLVFIYSIIFMIFVCKTLKIIIYIFLDIIFILSKKIAMLKY